MSRVMVLEDETMIAMLLEDMLCDLGHEVAVSVQRLEQAIPIASTANIDIAILDLNVGGTYSFPVAEILRERGIPFVFATGYGGEGPGERFAGVPVLGKPFAAPQLAEAFRKAQSD